MSTCSIALRVWRISTAAIALPSTNAGMIIARQVGLQVLERADVTRMPAASPACTEKSRISMMPSQKLGVDSPQSANILAA